jgi:hypothetical protein
MSKEAKSRLVGYRLILMTYFCMFELAKKSDTSNHVKFSGEFPGHQTGLSRFPILEAPIVCQSNSLEPVEKAKYFIKASFSQFSADLYWQITRNPAHFLIQTSRSSSQVRNTSPPFACILILKPMKI